MGMLKNLKSTVQNANAAAASAATMQAQVAGTAAGPPLPAADLEPIEGITLERYAELMADMGNARRDGRGCPRGLVRRERLHLGDLAQGAAGAGRPG